jgi:hypothetical protein
MQAVNVFMAKPPGGRYHPAVIGVEGTMPLLQQRSGDYGNSSDPAVLFWCAVVERLGLRLDFTRQEVERMVAVDKHAPT